MNKILKRDDFINEIYIPIKEQKEYTELISINEGLLKNLFGMVKNMFKKDWESIKGDAEIIKIYKEIDDNLTGFSIMKLSKKDQCNKIRQELVDFACDWYDYKMNNAKENDTDPKPAVSMKFKNDTLKSNFEATQDKIKNITDGDEQMQKWADILMNEMKLVINRSILADIHNEEAKKELEQKIEEDKKKQAELEEINKKMEKWQNGELKKVQDERKRLISDTKSTPIPDDLLGDKAIQNLCGEFDQIRRAKQNKKNSVNLFKNNKSLGFKSIFTNDDYNKKEFATAYELMDSFYTALGANDVMKKFNETPGQSVQAMCISVNAFIKNCLYGGTDYGDELPLMAKCAVISNGLVSYNLPLNDKTGDDAGNYFTDIVKIITDGQFKDTKGKKIKLPDDFKKNSETLLNKIISEAKKIKEQADKNYNESIKKLNIQNKKES